MYCRLVASCYTGKFYSFPAAGKVQDWFSAYQISYTVTNHQAGGVPAEISCMGQGLFPATRNFKCPDVFESA